MTNPRARAARGVFNSDQVHDVGRECALGEAIEQTTSFTRVSNSNLVETETDELGRITLLHLRQQGQRRHRDASCMGPPTP